LHNTGHEQDEPTEDVGQKQLGGKKLGKKVENAMEGKRGFLKRQG